MSWDSATCITYCTDYYRRINLESWFTNSEQTPQNRSQQLPAPYKRVIDGLKQNWQRQNEGTTDNLTNKNACYDETMIKDILESS